MSKENQPIQRIICGNNEEILKTLADESIDLIYIDPPFFTQEKFEIIWNDGAEIRQFNDRWITDKKSSEAKPTYSSKNIDVYLEWMESRLREIHRVLKKTGSLYLHCDYHADAYLRVMCDKIFDRNPLNAIVWQRSLGHSLANGIDNVTDLILYYSKSDNFIYNQQYIQIDDAEKRFPYIEENTNRRFNHQKLEKSSNIKEGDKTRVINGKTVTTKLGWVWTQSTIDKKIEENPNIIYWTKNGTPRYKIYADQYCGKKMTNLWNDILPIASQSKERLGYPTQKPEALLERIILASSNENDIVLDAFCGCGTTLAVAKKLNRQFIGIDVSPTACRLVAKRIGKRIDSIEGLPITPEEIGELDGNEFQNFIIREFGGFSGNRGADGGIDGFIGTCPIQVKKYKAGRKDLDEYIGSLLRQKKTEAIYIALDYSKDFRAEISRLKRENEITIYYFSVQDILDKLHYPIVDKFIPKHGLDKYQQFTPEK